MARVYLSVFIRLIKGVALSGLVLLLLGIAFVVLMPLVIDVKTLPENYGKVNSRLFLATGEQQPLLVYFGGSEGGNSMNKAHNVAERTLYQNAGYAVLALAYFGEDGIPSALDRISLNGVYQAIQEARTQPGIDAGCVIVAGGSKGAELALLLAATYPDIQAVLAFAPSDVVYSSPSFWTDGHTSSWMLNNQQVPAIPLSTNVLPAILLGDFRRAHQIARQDAENAERSRIPVEKIRGPVFLASGELDQIWPSMEMSDAIVNKLHALKFPFAVEHHVVPGGDHFQPQSDYHSQAIAFLNRHVRPHCAGLVP